MAENDHELPPYEESPQGIREAESQPGFTGTLRAYIEWIECMLMYGSLRLGPAEEHEWRGGRYHRLELVTGGFSTDEALLGCVRQGRLAMHWECEHAGGLYVYLIPEWALAETKASVWMPPDDGVLEEVYSVDEIVLQARATGNHVSLAVDPRLQKAVLSCEQRRDESNEVVRRIVVDVQSLDAATLWECGASGAGTR
jgi:hypothetical protein